MPSAMPAHLFSRASNSVLLRTRLGKHALHAIERGAVQGLLAIEGRLQNLGVEVSAKFDGDDPVIADVRHFYKVELWTRDDRVERMLFAGTSLDEARAVFADYARHRPAARLTIRQRSRVLAQWPKGDR
jgi:hypothetical protein